MNFAEILAIQVSLTGIRDVLRGLESLSRQLNDVDEDLMRLARTGAIWVAVGLAMATASVKAYDSFARFQMGVKALLGDRVGEKFAAEVQAYAVPSAYDPKLLRQFAQGLVLRRGPAQTMDIMKATTNLGAIGGADNASMQSIMLAVRQISSENVVNARNVRLQLARAQGGQVLAELTARAAGVKGIEGLVGMSSDKFIEALLKAGNAPNVRGAQEQLARISPLIGFENTVQAFQNALIPTGRLIALLLIPLNTFLQWVITIAGFLNQWTGGMIGFAVIVGLLTVGFRMMWGIVRLLIFDYRTNATALGRATIAVNTFAAAVERAAIASGGSSAVGGAGAAVAGAGAAAAGMGFRARIQVWLTEVSLRITLFIERVIGFFGRLAASPIIGFIVRFISVIGILGSLFFGIIKMIEWIANKIHPGTIDPKEGFGTGSEWQKRFKRNIWDHITGGGDPPKSSGDNKPQRRSDWENIYSRRFGNMMGG